MLFSANIAQTQTKLSRGWNEWRARHTSDDKKSKIDSVNFAFWNFTLFRRMCANWKTKREHPSPSLEARQREWIECERERTFCCCAQTWSSRRHRRYWNFQCFSPFFFFIFLSLFSLIFFSEQNKIRPMIVLAIDFLLAFAIFIFICIFFFFLSQSLPWSNIYSTDAAVDVKKADWMVNEIELKKTWTEHLNTFTVWR